MLIGFKVSNFLSFNEEVYFSMIASAERIHPHHVYKTSSRRHPNILRMATIYGANAAGKSSFVKAVKFVRNLVINGVKVDARIPIQRFRLEREALALPSAFEVQFRTKNINYSYAFSVDNTQVLSEKLCIITSTSSELLFSRTTSPDGEAVVEFGVFAEKLSAKDSQFLEFTGKGTRSNQLFLSETVERNIDRFRAPYNWFKNALRIIEPSTQYHQLEERVDSDVKLREFLSRVLEAAGTGVSDVRTKETVLDNIPEIPDELIKEAKQLFPENQYMYIRNNVGSRYSFSKRGDELRALKLTTLRNMNDGSGTAEFDVHEESDGTQRIFDLLPVLYDLTIGDKERVFIVDEIGRSLHPHITNLFLDLHLTAENATKPSQLIVTTHETNLLDLELLRRDEIWFVEKRANGSTDLYSLSDFQPRYDKDIRRAYLVGRYGAIPFTGNAQLLRLTSSSSAEKNTEVAKERHNDA